MIKVDPKQLVSMEPIEFEPTLKLWIQKIRFDFIVPNVPFEPMRVQIVLDRVHRFQRKLSRPVAYFHLSDPLKLQELAAHAVAASALLVVHASDKPVPSAFDIKIAVESAISSVTKLAYDLALAYSRLIQNKKVQLSIDRLLEAEAK